MTRAIILTFLLGIATLSGCVFPGVHKLPVQQGNIVTQDMLEQLKPDMTPNQVEYVMGTPVLKTTLSPSVWQYVYNLEEDDKITRQYQIRVFFNNKGRYSHYDGEVPEEDVPEEEALEEKTAAEAASATQSK